MQVWIVNEGGWGQLSAAEGSYDDYVPMLIRRLEGQVDGIHDVEDVEEALQQAIAAGGKAAFIFLTRGMIGRAQQIVQEHPDIRAVVLTGLPPSKGEFSDLDERVIILDKAKISDESVREAVLG